MDLIKGFHKIIHVLEKEDISYMIVGGFATSYYNRYRFTADIDFVLQVHPHHIDSIIKHFPEWKPFAEGFKESAVRGALFNLTDFDSGVKYDFMVYQDNDYNWTAFQRRRRIEFSKIECYIASAEDLIISKLIWYNISQSGKQKEDIEFLLTLDGLDRNYLDLWATKLFIKRHGLF